MKNKRRPHGQIKSVAAQSHRLALSVVLTGGALLGGMAGPAAAGDWVLSDSVTTSVIATKRTGRNESSGLVTQLRPQIQLSGRGGRSQADINYELSISAGFGDTNPQFLAHNLLASGQLEVIEDFFLIGANAGARLLGDSSVSGTVDSLNVKADGVQAYSLQITPEFRHHLGRYADIVSQNAIDFVDYSGDNASSQDFSYSFTSNIGLRSGTIYGPLSWRLDGTRRETKYEDDRTDTNTSYVAGLGYRVNHQLRLNGNVGYEENDVQTNRSDTDGEIWNVGAVWRPGPRTSVRADYGYRYFGNVYSARIDHSTRLSRSSIGFSKSVSNRREQELVSGFFILVDEQGIPLIDPATGGPIIASTEQLNQFDEDYVIKQARAAFTLSGRWTTLTLTGNIGTRTFEITPEEEDFYTLTASAIRNLGSNYSASVIGSLRHVEGGGNGESDNFDVQLSLIRQLSPRTSTSLDLLYREQDRSLGGDFKETRIGVSFKTSFL